jgi:phosphatidylinositol glycan class K
MNAPNCILQDLADALAQSSAKHRYNEVLIIAETCEAATLLERIDAPNIITLASSQRDEQSLSHRLDYSLGVSTLDR